MDVLMQTNIAGQKPKRGKVRDIYDLGDKLLIVATDRLSAFDVVMKSGIPYKGKVLTQISKFWFEFLGGDVEHHFQTDDVRQIPQAVLQLYGAIGRQKYAGQKGAGSAC